MLRLRTIVKGRAFRARTRQSYATTSPKKPSPLGDASRKNPSVIDQANATKKSGGGGGVLGVAIIALGAAGYVGIRLNKDKEFCVATRERAPIVVETFGKMMSLADESKESVSLEPTQPKELAPVPAAPPTAKDQDVPAEAPETEATAEQSTEDEVTEDNGNSEQVLPVETEESTSAAVDANAVEEVQAAVEDDESTVSVDDVAAEITKVVDAEMEVELAVNAALSKSEEILKEQVGDEELARLRSEVKAVEAQVGKYQAEVRQAAVDEVRATQEQLREDLEDVLANDLSSSSPETLKRRVVKLVMELQEQNKREAAKLIAVLDAAEGRASEKTMDALKKQAEKYEELMEARLADQEVKLRARFAMKLDETIADNSSRLQYISESQAEKYEKQLENKVAAVQEEVQARMRAELDIELQNHADAAAAAQGKRAEAVEEINNRLQALDKVFQWNTEYLQKSHQIHLVCTALLAFHESLEGDSNRISEAAASLKVAAGGDGIIDAALNSIPKSAYSGVATMPELQRRFERVKDEIRKSFFTPDDAGIFSSAVGTIAANLTVAPNGCVEGVSPEASLARAAYFLERGNLQRTIIEMEAIDANIAAVAGDWLKAARTRLLVTQATRLIGSHVTTLAATLS